MKREKIFTLRRRSRILLDRWLSTVEWQKVVRWFPSCKTTSKSQSKSYNKKTKMFSVFVIHTENQNKVTKEFMNLFFYKISYLRFRMDGSEEAPSPAERISRIFVEIRRIIYSIYCSGLELLKIQQFSLSDLFSIQNY